MRIGVMGSGGVGGYFGGLLASAGNPVVFVARGEHLDAMRKSGLTVKTHHFGQFKVKIEATDDPSRAGEVDLLLFAVKSYNNDAAIPAIRPMMGADTLVLTLQNGVDGYDQLSEALGKKHVLPGAAYIETRIEAPGVILQQGDVVRIVFGEPDGRVSPRASAILNLFADAGIKAELSPDIMKALWSKFIFVVALAGSTTAARAAMHELLSYTEGKQLVMDVLHEAEAVGRAKKINLDPDIFDKTMKYITTSARELRASMYTDLERGRPLELDALTGSVVRQGKLFGVPVPKNETIYALLKPYAKGRLS